MTSAFKVSGPVQRCVFPLALHIPTDKHLYNHFYITFYIEALILMGVFFHHSRQFIIYTKI